MHFYTAYGLLIASECPLGGRSVFDADRAPDVVISNGAVPDTLGPGTAAGIFYEITASEFLLRVGGVARYHVKDGSAITIQADRSADESSVLLFLLGSVFGALLHQRGTLPMQASAVEARRGAVLFAGPAGSGKSTIAAALHRRGYRFIADDISAVHVATGNVPTVVPAFPQVNLWTRSLNQLAIGTKDLTRVRSELEKYAVPIVEAFRREPLPAASVYVLTPKHDPNLSLTPVSGMHKMLLLRNQIYRRRMMEQMKADSRHFAAVGALANKAKVIQVSRPESPFLLEELATMLMADFDE